MGLFEPVWLPAWGARGCLPSAAAGAAAAGRIWHQHPADDSAAAVPHHTALGTIAAGGMEAAADAAERAVLEVVHPGLRWYDSPGDSWALVRLYDALLLLGAWGLLVAAVIAFTWNRFALERAERERRIGSTEGGGYRLGGAAAPVKAPAQGAAATGTAAQALFSASQIAVAGYSLWLARSEAEAAALLPVCNAFAESGRGGLPALVHLYFLSQLVELAEAALLMLVRREGDITPAYAVSRAAGFMLFWLHIRVGYDGDVCTVVATCAAIRLAGHSLHLLAAVAFGGVAPSWLQLCASALRLLPLCLSMAYAGLLFSGGCAQQAAGVVGLPKRLVILWVAYTGWIVLSADRNSVSGRLKVD